MRSSLLSPWVDNHSYCSCTGPLNIPETDNRGMERGSSTCSFVALLQDCPLRHWERHMKSFVSVFFTARKRSLGRGNIFSSMCQEFCSQGEEVCLSACWDTPPPPEQTPHQSRHPPGADTPPCTVHAGRYGQQVDGMHPTGMQSCLLKLSRLKGEFLKLRIHKPKEGVRALCSEVQVKQV